MLPHLIAVLLLAPESSLPTSAKQTHDQFPALGVFGGGGGQDWVDQEEVCSGSS